MRATKFSVLVRSAVATQASLIIHVIISLAALLELYRQGLIILSDDTFFPLNPNYALYHFAFSWNYGAVNSQNLVPIFFVLSVLYRFSHSLLFVQMLLLFSLFSGAGIGAILLYRRIINSRYLIGEVIVGAFYTFNLFSISVIWNSFQLRTIFYALLPYIVILFLSSLKSTAVSKKITYLTLLSFIISITGLYYIPLIVILLLSVSIPKIFRFSNRNLLFTWILFLPIAVLVNLYYGLGAIINLNTVISQHATAEPVSLFFLYPLAENVLNSFRLLGYSFIWYWGWGVPNYSWSVAVTSYPLFIISSLGPAIYSGYVLLFSPNKHIAVKLSASFVLIVGILLSSAGSPPFGQEVYEILSFLHLAAIYEIPFEIFGILIVFSYLVLLGLGIFETRLLRNDEQNQFRSTKFQTTSAKPDSDKHFFSPLRRFARIISYHKITNPKKLLAIMLLLFLIFSMILNSYPLWSGQMISDGIYRGQGQVAVPSAYVRVPRDYYSFDSFARQLDHNYSLLVLPPYSPASHVWEPGNESATDPLIEYFSGGLNVINLDNSVPSPLIDLINNLISRNVTGQSFLAILSHLSVRYILLEKDWLDLLHYMEPLQFYSSYLTNITSDYHSSVSELWNSTHLTLYQINQPTPYRIVQLVRYGYLVPTDYGSISSFYSFQRNANYPILPTYSDNYTCASNSLGLLAFQFSDSTLCQLDTGNYSVYVKGELNPYATNLSNVSNELAVQIGNQLYHVNVSQLLNVLGGSEPFATLKVSSSASYGFQLLLPSDISLFNGSELYNAMKDTSGWTYDTTSDTTFGINALGSLNTSLPAIFDFSFSLTIYKNPNETSYGGIGFESAGGTKIPLGLFFRLGPNSSEGGILLPQTYPLNYSSIYYDNFDLKQNETYRVDVQINNGLAEVAIDQTPVEFLFHGEPVTNNNETNYGAPGGFDGIRLITNGLPMEISNFTLYYKPVFVHTAIIMEDPPSFNPIISNYDLTQLNPSTFLVSNYGAQHSFYVMFSGPYDYDWRLATSLSSLNAFSNNSYQQFSGNLSGIQYWMITSGDSKSFYLYYTPQTTSNIGVVITIVSVMTLFLSLSAIKLRDSRRVFNFRKFLRAHLERSPEETTLEKAC